MHLQFVQYRKVLLFWVANREARSCCCSLALPKFPDSCSACEGSLAFPYCKELSACTLPLPFPIDRKDEWSSLKICDLQGRIAKHWSAKLKYLCSYTEVLTCLVFTALLAVHMYAHKWDFPKGPSWKRLWCVWEVTRSLLLNGYSSNLLLLTFARSHVVCIGDPAEKTELGISDLASFCSCSVWGVMDTEAGSCPMTYFAGSFLCFCSCLGQLIPWMATYS